MSTQTEKPSRKRRLAKSAVIAAAALAFFLAGAGFTKVGGWAGQGIFHHQGLHQQMMRAGVRTHVTWTLDQLEATPAQKAEVQGILDRFFTDHVTLEAEHKALHDRALAILTAEKIDRATLEQLRQDGLQKADLATSQIANLLADVAEVLTPAQRAQLKLLVEEHFK